MAKKTNNQTIATVDSNRIFAFLRGEAEIKSLITKRFGTPTETEKTAPRYKQFCKGDARCKGIEFRLSAEDSKYDRAFEWWYNEGAYNDIYVSRYFVQRFKLWSKVDGLTEYNTKHYIIRLSADSDSKQTAQKIVNQLTRIIKTETAKTA